MTSIVFIFMGVVTALAVFAMLAKRCASEPKKAEKWEKGEIIRQLLELSEGENGISAIASPPARSLRFGSTSATQSDALPRCVYRGHNAERRYSSLSHTSPTPLRSNLTDAEIEEQIRQRAYELYQARGGVGGNATGDWQQAKEEVLSRKAKSATTSS
jgi:hypothetical protein